MCLSLWLRGCVLFSVTFPITCGSVSWEFAMAVAQCGWRCVCHCCLNSGTVLVFFSLFFWIGLCSDFRHCSNHLWSPLWLSQGLSHSVVSDVFVTVVESLCSDFHHCSNHLWSPLRLFQCLSHSAVIEVFASVCVGFWVYYRHTSNDLRSC